MQTNPISQSNAATQMGQVAPKQDPQPIQAPVQQKPQAAQKDEVVLSQAAKDMAAQLSGRSAQEEAKESPAAAMQEGGITNVIK